MDVSILLVSTNKYKQFVQPLLDGIVKNFLPDHQITVHLFTDGIQHSLKTSDRVTIRQHLIPSYKFPHATLFRYKIFTEFTHAIKGDYVFYMDVDMEISGTVTDEILTGDIVATRHPGFYANNGWGSENNNPESTSALPKDMRKKYYAGGFQGGKTNRYLHMALILASNIQRDQDKGIMAEWHDETHWNHFCNYAMERNFPDWKLTELSPSYCSVPSEERRKLWGIDHLPQIITALDKNHEEIRA